MFLPRTTVIEMVDMTRTEECFLVQRCFFGVVGLFCFVWGMGLLHMQTNKGWTSETIGKKCMPGSPLWPFLGWLSNTFKGCWWPSQRWGIVWSRNWITGWKKTPIRVLISNAQKTNLLSPWKLNFHGRANFGANMIGVWQKTIHMQLIGKIIREGSWKFTSRWVKETERPSTLVRERWWSTFCHKKSNAM